jgi:hypothetical protein
MVPGVSSGAMVGQQAAGHLCRSASRLPRCERGSDYGPTWPEVAEDQFAGVLRCPVATTAPTRLCVTEKSAPRSRGKSACGVAETIRVTWPTLAALAGSDLLHAMHRRVARGTIGGCSGR